MATASRNCFSVSQWCWFTTPSRRKGTMASPLPKMKAPAFRKNRPRATSVLAVAIPVSRLKGRATPSAEVDWPRLRNRGGASQAIITRPAATNRIAISAPVRAVTARITAEMPHRRRSFAFVSLASFTAAKAMIAMTAGAIP